MKYIVTKDGKVYKVDEDCMDIPFEAGAVHVVGSEYPVSPLKILRRTNTIKGLCDYFASEDAFCYINPSLHCRFSVAKGYADKRGKGWLATFALPMTKGLEP